jgi:hypothetical protein
MTQLLVRDAPLKGGRVQKPKNWCKDEYTELKDYLSEGLATDEIAQRLDRPIKAVIERLTYARHDIDAGVTYERLGHRWTPEENERLLSIESESARSELARLAKEFKRPSHHCRIQRKTLNRHKRDAAAPKAKRQKRGEEVEVRSPPVAPAPGTQEGYFALRRRIRELLRSETIPHHMLENVLMELGVNPFYQRKKHKSRYVSLFNCLACGDDVRNELHRFYIELANDK